ncbi:MAG: hypothetical protein LWW86_10925 [Micrococcales bacterium]|nr:hypothetical protein [Micrococcales bacterium]
MSLHDLPDDWATRPVHDPEIAADVVDLIVRESDRDDGAVCLLLCHPDGRLLQPVTIGLEGVSPPLAERREMIGALAASLPEDLCVVAAIARRHGYRASDDDRVWHQVLIDAFGQALSGCFVATHDGVLELPPPLDAVS